MNITLLYHWMTKLIAPALLSAAITLVVTLAFLYEQQEARKQLLYQELSTQAQQLSEWLDKNFSIINNVLIDVDPDSIQCDGDSLFQLRSLMFNVAPVVEMGLVSSAGELVCTSWQKHQSNLLVQAPPKHYGLRFTGPIQVEYIGQPAFVLARTLSDGSEVNALVRISWLKNQLFSHSSELGFTALINSDTGEPIVTNGRYSKPLSNHVFPVDSAQIFDGVFDNRREQVSAFSPLATLPGLSVVVSDEKSLLNNQATSVAPLWLVSVFLWLLLLILFYLVLRYLSGSGHLLRSALKNGEFINYYQPIIRNTDRHIVGVEVLMRWLHPVEGLKSPITFIPEATALGLMNQMTSHQLKQCYEQLKPILQRDPEFLVTINISACHLLSEQSIDEFIAYKKLMPGLVLEVTEDVLIENQNQQIENAFNRLNHARIDIAIDDFGTGYCGLSYLSQLPVRYLKADKSFVASIGTDAMNSHLLEMIVSLSKSLGLITIAEGVETLEQARILEQLNVELHQGWLYSKALPADQLSELIEQFDVEFETELI